MATTATVFTRAIANDGTQDVSRRDWSTDIAAAVLEIDNVTLSNGSNTLTVPAGATWVVLSFTSGAVSYTLKGVAGDTGVRLSTAALPTGPVSMPIVGGTTVLVIGATGAGAVTAYWY